MNVVEINTPADMENAIDGWHRRVEGVMCEMMTVRVSGKHIPLSVIPLAQGFNTITDDLRKYV